MTALPGWRDRPLQPINLVGDPPAERIPRRPHLALDLDLPAWFECYLADCQARGVTPRTHEWYRDRGSRLLWLLEGAGIRQPDDLTRRAVSELFGNLRRLRHRGRPLAPQTIRGYWQAGTGFTTFLIAEGAHPGSNLFDQFGKPVPEKVMWTASAEECAAMLRIPIANGYRGFGTS